MICTPRDTPGSCQVYGQNVNLSKDVLFWVGKIGLPCMASKGKPNEVSHLWQGKENS